MNQAGVGKQLGFTGSMNGYYYATSEEIDAMVDVYLEEATGGYRIYFMNGNDKTYLNVIPRDNDNTKTNVVLQTLAQNATPSVYELNTEFGYVKTACVGTDWYLGTYGTNVTIGASKTSYISDTTTIGVSQFVAWFATAGEGGSTTPDPEPEQPAKILIDKVADLVAGTYKMAAYLTKNSNNQSLEAAPYHLWDGTVSSTAPATSNSDLNTNSYALNNNVLTAAGTDNAADVVLVAVEGKENTYYIMVGEQYLYSAAAGTNRRMGLSATPAEWVATDNANGGISLSSNGVFLGSANATSRYLRSYASETTLKYGVVFFNLSANETPENPPAGNEPEGKVVTIAEAIAIGSALEHDQYTTEKYKVTGTVLSITSAQYGNMVIQDENGNALTIYGTYDATGDVQYGSMTEKPDEGDVVTIYGPIGCYSNSPQIKNGWILSFTPGELPEVEGPEGSKFSLSFADKANRTVFTSSQQVWVQNGITVTNDKSSSTSNVADYSNPARFYKSSKVTVASTGMKTIVFTCGDPSYATALKNSIGTVSGATVESSGMTVTVTFSAAVDTFVVESLTAQVRVASIDVYK